MHSKQIVNNADELQLSQQVSLYQIQEFIKKTISKSSLNSHVYWNSLYINTVTAQSGCLTTHLFQYLNRLIEKFNIVRVFTILNNLLQKQRILYKPRSGNILTRHAYISQRHISLIQIQDTCQSKIASHVHIDISMLNPCNCRHFSSDPIETCQFPQDRDMSVYTRQKHVS